MGDLPKITDFPQDGRPWLLSWVGPLAPSDDGDFLVSVSMICLKTALLSHQIRARDIDKAVRASDNGRLQVKLSPKYFPILEIGSIWTDGQFPPLRCTNTASFEIDTTRITMRPVNELETQSMFLKGDDLRTSVASVEATQIVGDVRNTMTLVIPATEIFRFYYGGGSSTLSAALLDGTLVKAPERVVRDVYKRSDGTKYAVLGYGIDECVCVSRFWFDDFASKQIVEIFGRGGWENGAWAISILPPFQGASILTVAGKQITNRDGSVGFLVFRIERCDRPYGPVYCAKVTESAVGDGSNGDAVVGTDEKPRKRRRLPASGPELVEKAHASFGDIPKHFASLVSADRFPNIEHISVTVQRNRGTGRPSVDRPDRPPVSTLGSASGRGDAGPALLIAHAEDERIVNFFNKPIEDGLAEFERAVDLLPFTPKCKLAVARPVSRQTFRNIDSTWSTVYDRITLQVRLRQCAVAKLRGPLRDFYLCEIEPKSKSVKTYFGIAYREIPPLFIDSDQVDALTFADQLEAYEREQRIVTDERVREVRLIRVRHPTYMPGSTFAFRLAETIARRLAKIDSGSK